MVSIFNRFLSFGLLISTLLLSACIEVVATTSPEAVEESASAPPEPAQETSPAEVVLQRIDLGVGYVPNVQFAPFYVAQAKGFFADEGLEVVLEHGFENDFVALTAQGERQFAIASGDQVILARSQGLPLVYVMKWYERFPVGVMVLADSGIDSPAALESKKVGIPGLFGASFAGWKALVYATGIDESQVQLESIGFTQAEAMRQGQIEAAVVYLANEPVQLSQEGMELNVFEVSEYIDLVSNGIVTNETVIAENPDLIRRLVNGSLRGLAYTLENPDEAFEIVRQAIPEMTDDDAPIQRAVLDRSLELWQSETPGLSSEAAWAASAGFILEAGIIETPVEVDKLYSNDFVE